MHVASIAITRDYAQPNEDSFGLFAHDGYDFNNTGAFVKLLGGVDCAAETRSEIKAAEGILLKNLADASAGIDPNAIRKTLKPDDVMAVLHLAVRHSTANVVRALLQHPAIDVNALLHDHEADHNVLTYLAENIHERFSCNAPASRFSFELGQTAGIFHALIHTPAFNVAYRTRPDKAEAKGRTATEILSKKVGNRADELYTLVNDLITERAFAYGITKMTDNDRTNMRLRLEAAAKSILSTLSTYIKGTGDLHNDIITTLVPKLKEGLQQGKDGTFYQPQGFNRLNREIFKDAPPPCPEEIAYATNLFLNRLWERAVTETMTKLHMPDKAQAIVRAGHDKLARLAA